MREHEHKLGLFDASSGRLVRWVLNEPHDDMMVTSTAVEGGSIWVTLSRGPACTSDINGCGPKPDSCSGEVITLDPSTGSIAAVLTASSGELIGDAQPSPDGRYLAYLDGVCDRSYFNQYIRVRDLHSGKSWTIGADLAPCHTLGSLSWLPNGTHLALDYGPSQLTSAAGSEQNYGAGTCRQPAPTHLAVAPALSTQPGLGGPTGDTDPGCEVEAATATNAGYAAIEGCGGPGHSYLSGPIRLLHYTHSLQPAGATSLGHCLDGAELRANTAGTTLLGSTYQFCNPPGSPGPKTIAFTDNGHGPRTFYAKPNGGEDAFRAISW